MTTILDSFMMDGNKEKTMNRIKLSGSFISIPSFSLFNVTKHDIRFISCSDEILPHTYASILHSSIEYEYLMSIKFKIQNLCRSTYSFHAHKQLYFCENFHVKQPIITYRDDDLIEKMVLKGLI